MLAAKTALEDEPEKARTKAWKTTQSMSLETVSADSGHNNLLEILESGPMKLGKEMIVRNQEAFSKFFKVTYRRRGRAMADYFRDKT